MNIVTPNAHAETNFVMNDLDDVTPMAPPEAATLTASGQGNKVQPFPLEWVGSVCEAVEVKDFVEGLLIEGEISVLFGPSNVGKSFLAVDLACSVACRPKWRGREVENGGVIYLALEGMLGLKNRIYGWKLHHHQKEDIGLAAVSVPVNLRDPVQVERFQMTIEQAKEACMEKFGMPIKLIIVDTFSRAMAGGDENSAQDVGELIQALDFIRIETGCHIMLIHHAGKDSTRGPRGSSALHAAVDTEAEVQEGVEEHVALAKVTKQRNLPKGANFHFTLEIIETGRDRRGRQITTCVAVPTSPRDGSDPCKKLTDNESLALTILNQEIAACGQELHVAGLSIGTRSGSLKAWRGRWNRDEANAGKNADTRGKAFKRSMEALTKAAYIAMQGDRVWVLSEEESEIADDLAGLDEV